MSECPFPLIFDSFQISLLYYFFEATNPSSRLSTQHTNKSKKLKHGQVPTCHPPTHSFPRSHALKCSTLITSSCSGQKGKIQNCQPVTRKHHTHSLTSSWCLRNEPRIKQTMAEPKLTTLPEEPLGMIGHRVKHDMMCRNCTAVSNVPGLKVETSFKYQTVRYLPYHPPSAPSFLLDIQKKTDSSDHKVKLLYTELSLTSCEVTPLCKQWAGKPDNKPTQEQFKQMLITF